jgi:DNA-binding NarL/FixJ family response regulator
MVAYGLEHLACLAYPCGEPRRCLRLASAAQRLRAAIGVVSPHWERGRLEALAASARAALSPADAERAWAEGAALPLEQAVQDALALPPPVQPVRAAPAETAAPAGSGSIGRGSRDVPGDSLTRREREVVALVAEGLTNRQIAERLVISERTADTHVQNVLGKLGFSTRSQVAAWAARQDAA